MRVVSSRLHSRTDCDLVSTSAWVVVLSLQAGVIGAVVMVLAVEIMEGEDGKNTGNSG